MNVTRTVEGTRRFPVNVRYPRETRDHVDKLGGLLVMSPLGAQVPLGNLAEISVSKGPAMIKSDNARKTNWVFVYLGTKDVGGYVKRAKQAVDENINFKDYPGYSIKWSGQYEFMEAAKQRFKLVVPITFAIIFLLLYLHFKNMTETMVVMLSLPFALVGGIWLMSLLGYQASVAVYVGFIALSGLAAETGVVMLVYLDEAYERYALEGRMNNIGNLQKAVIEGSVMRVRPKIMTVGTTLLGLFPIMLGSGAGSEVMKRIAAPMVGGLFTSALLTLIVIPAIYVLIKSFQIKPKGA